MKRLLLCALLVTALPGCDSGSDTDAFSASLLDEAGAPVFEGELRLVFEEDNTDGPQPVTGTWRLEGAGGRPDPRPPSGVVRGSRLGTGIGLTLDMNASDSGLDLSGTYDGDRISGTWSTITIGGPLPSGTFEALRE